MHMCRRMFGNGRMPANFSVTDPDGNTALHYLSKCVVARYRLRTLIGAVDKGWHSPLCSCA